MKIFTFIILALSFIITGSVNAQSASDSITIQKKFSTVFIQNGQRLTPRQLLEITKNNDYAYKEMKIAKTNYDAGLVFGFAGGFMVGWPFGTAIAGGDPNWVLAGIGAGLIVVSIPFSTSYTKHAKNAVSIYNSGLSQPEATKIDFNVGLTSNGIGVRLTF